MLQRMTLRDAIEAIRQARGREASRVARAIEGSELFLPYTPSDADLREAQIRVDAMPFDRSGDWFSYWSER